MSKSALRKYSIARSIIAAVAGAGLTWLTIFGAAGCSKVFQKSYRLPDESTPVVNIGNYKIVVTLESRLTGYKVIEDEFYPTIDVAYVGKWDSTLAVTPMDFIAIDSVCVTFFKSDSVACIKKVDQYAMLDDYYNRNDYLTRYKFGAVILSPGNAFVDIAYTVRITDPETGAMVKTERLTHELKRYAYRTY